MNRRHIDFLKEHKEREAESKALKKWRRIFLLSIIAFFLMTAGCVSRTFFTSEPINDPAQYDPETLEPKTPEGILSRIKQLVFPKDDALAGEEKDRINILLLGMGGPGHDGPYLTDTIIIASIKPSTGQIAMISIPRDLGVDIPGYGWRKINHANAFGEMEKANWGGAFATEVIEDRFDIDINYYARVDFKAFEEIVNEVGGVTVNVERYFVDEQFPAPNDAYQTLTFQKGKQTMDGARALMYARSRHGNNGEGSDFARAKRQQKVILALKEKMLSFGTLFNPIKINNVIKSLDKHITTNMEFSSIIKLVKTARELDTTNIITVVLDTSVGGYLKNGYSASGAFILEPVTGNFDDINSMIENIFEEGEVVLDDTPAQDEPDYSYASIEIKNGTWYVGMASRVKKRLQDEGFYISDIGNTEERPITSSGIYNIDENKYPEIAQALQKELNIPIKQTLPEGEVASTSTEILIILGEDIQE
jgi:polyisoprenyl-teichoic acid--peptidoglycan teichoic acid transferase